MATQVSGHVASTWATSPTTTATSACSRRRAWARFGSTIYAMPSARRRSRSWTRTPSSPTWATSTTQRLSGTCITSRAGRTPQRCKKRSAETLSGSLSRTPKNSAHQGGPGQARSNSAAQYLTACKAVYTASIPVGASRGVPADERQSGGPAFTRALTSLSGPG